jgi:hypothetical protein
MTLTSLKPLAYVPACATASNQPDFPAPGVIQPGFSLTIDF